MQHIIPPALKRGDTIGIIAPASQQHGTDKMESGLTVLWDMGYEPVFPRELWPGTGYLADTDDNRAKELVRLWHDDSIKAILALRGGYGCLRILNQVDPVIMRRQPKWLIGFSDLSVLHAHIQQKTGLCSLHGPSLTTLDNVSRPSLERFFGCLAGKWTVPIRDNRIEILQGEDNGKGVLLGGNLASLLTLIGTPYEPDWKGAILFLEETAEPLYRIDRMLTQLALAGKLNGIRGLILGDFTADENMDQVERLRLHEYVWQRVLDLLPDRSIPVWGGFPIGHGKDNMTLVHGMAATMDMKKCELRIG